VAELLFEPVTGHEHPGLAPYRSLRRRKDLERQARFVVEGDKVVQRFLESPFPVESLLITEEWFERIRDLLDRREDRIRVFLAQRKEQIEAVTGFGCFQGIKAVGRIAQPATLEDVLERGPRPLLLVGLDGISNAENMGVLVRNAAALGVHALLIGETSCSPFLTRAIRTSMGAIFRLPAVENLRLVEAVRRLRASGVHCIAAHPAADASPINDSDLTRDCCLIFGSEGYGITQPVLEACDDRVTIPMTRGVDSLNVGSAAAVVFYEILRQRTGTSR
jgi:tRNA G18 (ribose-2'-O)-methylase SpoU